MKTVIITLLTALAIFAQQTYRYTGTCSATVAASGTLVCTVQQPSNVPPAQGYQVTFEPVTAQCPGQAFTVDQATGGAAATTTAVTLVNAGGPGVPQPLPAVTIFTASNVGSGTALYPTLTYSSGSIAAVDLGSMRLGNTGTTSNYSLTLTNTGSASCAAKIAFVVKESR